MSSCESSEDEKSALGFQQQPVMYIPVFFTGHNPAKQKRKHKRRTKTWMCSECDEEFTDKETFKSHQVACKKEKERNARATAKKQFQCDKCDNSYTRKYNLRKHVKSAHDKDSIEEEKSRSENSGAKKLWPCDKCGKSYTLKTNLQRHVGAAHKESSVKVKSSTNTEILRAKSPLSCDKCEKSFGHRKKWQKHVRTEHGQENVQEQEPPEKRSKPQKYKCIFCKKVLLGVLSHCRNAHNVISPEEILLNNGKPLCSKKELEEAENRYNDINICQLCKSDVCDIKFDSSDLLMAHYVRDHKIDFESLEGIKQLCRVQKPKRDTKKTVLIEKDSEVIGKEDNSEENLNTRKIYKRKRGITTESNEECVEHSQDHPVAKYTGNKECDKKNMSSTSTYSARWFCSTCKIYVDVSSIETHTHPMKILICPPGREKNAKVHNKTTVEKNEKQVIQIDDQTRTENEEVDKENGDRMEISDDKYHHNSDEPLLTQELQRILESDSDDKINHGQEVSEKLSEDEEELAETNEERNNSNVTETLSTQDLLNILGGDANKEIHEQGNSEVSDNISEGEGVEINVTDSEDSDSDSENYKLDATIENSEYRKTITAQNIINQYHMLIN